MLARLFHRTFGSLARFVALLVGLLISLITYVAAVVALHALIGGWTLPVVVGFPAAWWINGRRSHLMYRGSRRAAVALGVCPQCHGTGRTTEYLGTGLRNPNGIENLRRSRGPCGACYGSGRYVRGAR